MYRIVASVMLILVLGGLYYFNEIIPAQTAAQPQVKPTSEGGLTADERAMKNLKID